MGFFVNIIHKWEYLWYNGIRHYTVTSGASAYKRYEVSYSVITSDYTERRECISW